MSQNRSILQIDSDMTNDEQHRVTEVDETTALLKPGHDERTIEETIGEADKDWHVEDVGEVDIPSAPADDQYDPSRGIWGVKFSWKKLWAYTGPGWLMSIAYLDPGNLESDLQAGAQAGYSLIWVLLWAHIMGLVFQCLTARLGTVTHRNMAQLARQEYPRPAAMAIWIMTEIAIIGSDIQEVIGSAIAMKILFGLPLWAGVLITACDTFTMLFLNFFGIRKLEALFAFLITMMAVTFGIEFGIGKPLFSDVISGFVPRVPANAVSNAVSMIGAVIMPHNIYLHSALVQSRNVDRSSKRAVDEAIYYFSVESAISLTVSFFINMFVVAVFAKGFYIDGVPNNDIGLFEAGDNLRERFGRGAQLVWAIGLLASGQSSTMTGTFAGQFVMQGFLNLQISPWIRTFVTRSVAIVPTIIVALMFTSDLDTLDQFLNILQSIQLPFALFPLLAFCSSKSILGDYSLGRVGKVIFWIAVVSIVGINIYLVVQQVQDSADYLSWWGYLIIAILSVAYLGFMGYLAMFKAMRKTRTQSEYNAVRNQENVVSSNKLAH
jgi:NRAMP (natural resistance-associated macrophage protein)-like metal ion transporter